MCHFGFLGPGKRLIPPQRSVDTRSIALALLSERQIAGNGGGMQDNRQWARLKGVTLGTQILKPPPERVPVRTPK